MYGYVDVDPSNNVAVGQPFTTPSARSLALDSLTLDWPARAADARLAYLLSASAVRFLAERGGERGLGAFFHAWRDSGSFDAALRSELLVDTLDHRRAVAYSARWAPESPAFEIERADHDRELGAEIEHFLGREPIANCVQPRAQSMQGERVVTAVEPARV